MKRLISLIIIIVSVLTLSSCNQPNPYDYRDDESLTAYFFDVGQADSSLLLFPDGTVMLIDCGNKADGDRLVKFIKGLNIKVIDYLVLSHPHEDHIGGALDIFENFDVSTVCFPKIDNAVNIDSTIYDDVLSAADDEECRKLPLTFGTLVVEKEDYNITAVSPVDNCVYSDLNDYSLSLLVNCYTNTLLFMGDAGTPAETDMLRQNINLHTDILKVGHHGSETSSSQEFLNFVKPQVAIVSSGKGNSYGHPNSEVLKRLLDRNVKVYRTDTVGTVIAQLYDGGFNIETNQEIDLDGN